MWDFPSGLRLLMGWKNTVAHTKMLANSIPPHLPIYLYTCPRGSGHPSTPLGCSQGNQGRSSSALLSTQMRVHIHLMVARGVYAHLFSTVWQWAVIDSLENSTGEVCPYRTVLLKLYCAHVSPRDLVSGQVWGRAWEAGFLTHSRMTWQCWSLGHTLSSEAMLCSWVKSQQVRALPWVQVNSGGRKPGNHHLLTLGGDEEAFSQHGSQSHLITAVTWGTLKTFDIRFPPLKSFLFHLHEVWPGHMYFLKLPRASVV